MAVLHEDVRDIKHCQSDMAQQIAGLRCEQAGDAETVEGGKERQ